MPQIHPFLWFDTQAGEAAEFYTSIFPNSRVTDVVRYGEAGPGEAGTVMTVSFELDGKPFTALNGGPAHAGFSLGVSFVIDCSSGEELDHYWDALTAGGTVSSCGWLQDRFGLPWQVVPAGMPAVLGDPDPVRARAAMTAMLAMTKLDLAAMATAAEETGTHGCVAVSKWVAASAEVLFGLLTDPSRHPGIDGASMLRSAEPQTLKAVGDEFLVNMHNDEMGNYVMSNRVVEYQPGRRITWEPHLVRTERDNPDADSDGNAPPAHRWGYNLIPTGPGSTVVTELYDCTRSPEWLRRATDDGNGWRPAMAATLEKLATAAALSD